jgi:hypothetical protein
MTGSWQITGVSQKFPGARGSGSASLVQSGNSITGTYNTTGGCANTSAVTGTVAGSNIALQFDENGQMGSLTGTVNAAFTSASGNFTSPSGGCLNGDYGTWSAVKN